MFRHWPTWRRHVQLRTPMWTRFLILPALMQNTLKPWADYSRNTVSSSLILMILITWVWAVSSSHFIFCLYNPAYFMYYLFVGQFPLFFFTGCFQAECEFKSYPSLSEYTKHQYNSIEFLNHIQGNALWLIVSSHWMGHNWNFFLIPFLSVAKSRCFIVKDNTGFVTERERW